MNIPVWHAGHADIAALSGLDNLVWGDKCPEPTGIIKFWNNQERHRQKTPWLGASLSITPPFCSLPGGSAIAEFKNRNEAAWAKIIKHGYVLTVWQSETLVGSVAVVLFRYGGSVHGRVHKVSVHPEHRLSGIGTALMRETIRMADKHSLSLSVSANQDNPAAVQLYRKAGFNILNGKDLSKHTNLLSNAGIEFSFHAQKIQLVRPVGHSRVTTRSKETLTLARE